MSEAQFVLIAGEVEAAPAELRQFLADEIGDLSGVAPGQQLRC